MSRPLQILSPAPAKEYKQTNETTTELNAIESVRISPSHSLSELNANIEHLEGLHGRLRSLLEELEEYVK